LAASIIAFTAGGAEGGATARPSGSSRAVGVLAIALEQSAAISSDATAPARRTEIPLRMKSEYRQLD
jgi:hypothetical protein